MGGSLFESIGIIDNLDDPQLFFNRKPVIYGFVIVSLVSRLGPLLRRLALKSSAWVG